MLHSTLLALGREQKPVKDIFFFSKTDKSGTVFPHSRQQGRDRNRFFDAIQIIIHVENVCGCDQCIDHIDQTILP